MTTFAKALGGAGAVGAGMLAYASLIERNAFTLRRFDLPVLPAGGRPLRVLHLSDIHLMPGQRRKMAWLTRLAALAPDLVVNTGDNIAHPQSIAPLMRTFEPLLGVPGVFVLGSNDYFAPTLKNPVNYLLGKKADPDSARLPTARLVAELTGAGWLDLDNARASLDVGGVNVEFVGVDDPHIDLDRYADVAGPADPAAALTIGVTHAPYTRVLDAMAADGAGLLIAGHTHGGQLAVPGYGALVTNCDLDTRRVKGVSRWWPGAAGISSAQAPEDAAWMHVSAGLGTSPFAPFRFACFPEATLLTLRPRA